MNNEIYVLIRQLEEDNEIFVDCFYSLEKAKEHLESRKKAHLDFYNKSENSEDFDFTDTSFSDYSEGVYNRIEKRFII